MWENEQDKLDLIEKFKESMAAALDGYYEDSRGIEYETNLDEIGD